MVLSNSAKTTFERKLEFDVVMFDDIVDLEPADVGGGLTVESCAFTADDFYPPSGYIVAESDRVVAESRSSIGGE